MAGAIATAACLVGASAWAQPANSGGAGPAQKDTANRLLASAADLNMTPSPEAAVKVASVKGKVARKRAYVSSRVTVSSAGRIEQSATTGKGKRSTRCAAAKKVAAAGTFRVKCKMGKKARTALRKRAMKLTLHTVFIPPEGPPVSVDKKLKIKRKR
ncbi:MAG: hypothetical protein KGR19_08735 [Acidobacteria bacterium]|nr:hypothetical protein [Acidobacteriota bacterium]